ncbi:MAG: hypothetical protein M3Q07_14285 [Pseudobdellovibrionaceae bacterium]|nr:hypothetical protein [Pseudobdellovibrionaceae bacterium]
MNTNNGGHTTLGVTGFTEFSENEVPSIIAQSGRAGARLNCDEFYLSVNAHFKKLLPSTAWGTPSSTLSQIWSAECYLDHIKPAFVGSGMLLA